MPNPPPPAPPTNRRRPYLIAAGVVFVAGLVVGAVTLSVIQRWQTNGGGAAGDDSGNGTVGAASPLGVTLYYVAEDGLRLVERQLDMAYGGDTLSRARAVVERQLDEAPSPLVSPFPDGTTLRALFLADDGNAFVDLSGDVTTGHSGGSLDELFTVYALVNALTTNVPEISAVQIIIDGAEVDTLAGHIDLRQPLAPSMKWVIDPNAIPEDDAADAESVDVDVDPDDATRTTAPPGRSSS